MSVVKIKNRTTSSEAEFNENASSNNSLIYTTAPDIGVEEFSIEITIGDGWNDRYSQGDKRLWKIDKSITLRRHGSIVVEVSEEIRVPNNKYGILLPTGSIFLGLGVIIASAKVEPAFHGKLKVRMYNTTTENIEIDKGTKIGSIVFFSTESTSPLPKIFKTGEISSSTIPIRTKIYKWISANRIIVFGWVISILSSSMLAMIFMYFVYYRPLLNIQIK